MGFAKAHPDCLKVVCVCARACVYAHVSMISLAHTPNSYLPLLYTQNVAVSLGTSDADYAKLKKIIESVPEVEYICVDVANGYSEHFVQFLRDVRRDFPNHTIIVSISCMIDHTSTHVACHSVSLLLVHEALHRFVHSPCYVLGA